MRMPIHEAAEREARQRQKQKERWAGTGAFVQTNVGVSSSRRPREDARMPLRGPIDAARDTSIQGEARGEVDVTA